MPDPEVRKPYHLENGLPDYQRTPEPVKEFMEEYGCYPVKLAVNPKHRVTWKAYFIPTPMHIPASIEPLSDKDIPGQEMQGYHIPIEYSEEVDKHSLLCIGLQALIDP